MSDRVRRARNDEIISKSSPQSVDECVSKFTELVGSHDLTVFVVIDHSGEARQHGLSLRETKLVIFGSPEAGTPVMVAEPLAALDLPLKVLIWDNDGVTTISYLSPTALADRYHLDVSLASNLAGIGALIDALLAE